MTPLPYDATISSNASKSSATVAAWVPAVSAGVAALLCYMNSLDGDFMHDDMVAVVGNPDVTGETRRHESSLANYYPNGRQVRGYHTANVALHCACSVLVAIVARCVMRIQALHVCLAAMLFAAHPVHTEAVSGIISQRYAPMPVATESVPAWHKFNTSMNVSSHRDMRKLPKDKSRTSKEQR
nr:protein O-mannosyl-transferase TMTC1-like [Dermacentor andersoni]